FVEPDEVMPARKLDRRMKRRERLHDHFAFNVTAPGASGDLSQQLKRPFARPKIRLMQGKIGVNDADECDVREVQTLGDHLGSDQDVNLACAKITEDTAIIVFAFQRIGIHSRDARIRKKFGKRLFYFLRAEAGVADLRVATFRVRTNGGHGRMMTADMA